MVFEFSINKQQLLSPLLMVSGAVDKKQSLPILSNILLELSNQQLRVTATDLEIQITAVVPYATTSEGAATIPAKKIIDIIRSLDDTAIPTLTWNGTTLLITTEHSQFKLSTLPASDYPGAAQDQGELEFTLAASALLRLLQATYFAMAQQDARVYLNGLFLEIDPTALTAVSADGHRMAICRMPNQRFAQHHRLLIPKKGIQEILRLLATIPDESVVVSAGKNHISLLTSHFKFSSKLMEGRFPPYAKAIPQHHDKMVIVDRELLKRALSRIIILANEKLRAVILRIEPNRLTLLASNKDQEEGTETLAAETHGEGLTIALNATYLLDVLHYFNEGYLRLVLGDADSSILVQSLHDPHYQYIIMPMKL